MLCERWVLTLVPAQNGIFDHPTNGNAQHFMSYLVRVCLNLSRAVSASTLCVHMNIVWE